MNIINYYANQKRVLDIAKEIVKKYESKGSMSCAPDVVAALKALIVKDKDDFATWNDMNTNYIQVTYNLVGNITQDLLLSGKYDMMGHYPVGGVGRQLIRVQHGCTEYFVSIGEITEEEGIKLDAQLADERRHRLY